MAAGVADPRDVTEIDAAVRSSVPRSIGRSATVDRRSPAVWSAPSSTTVSCDCAPTSLAWSERVTAADPDDLSPLAPRECGRSAAYAAWLAGDVAGGR